jgi:hypothetical protein
MNTIRRKRKLIKYIEPLLSSVLLRELIPFPSFAIREAEVTTVTIDNRVAIIAEYSKPKVPIKGRKVKVTDMTRTIANEISTTGENNNL